MARNGRAMLAATFVILALILAPDKVLSFCDYCDSPISTVTKSGWTITLNSVSPLNDGNFDWYYTIQNADGNASGLNFAAILIPDCCTAPSIISYTTVDNRHSGASGFQDIFDVAQGEPTLYFGRYIQQGYVVKGSPDNSTAYNLITNTQERADTTMILKLKKDAISFEIPGPGCLPPYQETAIGTIPGLSTQVIPLDNRITLVIRRGPDGCQLDRSIPVAERVQFFLDCPTGNLQTCGTDGVLLLAETIDVPDDFIYCSGISSCPECLQGSGGMSPTFYTYTIGGRTYKMCYDPDNPPNYECQ